MRVKLNVAYMGFPAGTIVESSGLWDQITLLGQCEILSLNDTPPVTVPYLVNKVASANVHNSFDAAAVSTSATYEKLKTITLPDGLLGSQRFLFDIGTNDSEVAAYGKIYRNGVALGTEQSSTSGIGSITAFTGTPVAGGSGYLPNEVLEVAGGTGGQVTVATIAATGGLETVTSGAVGSGYSVNDELTLVQEGASGGKIIVDTVKLGAIGTVASAPTAGGSGYLPADVLTLTEGTGGTVTVLTIAATGGLQTVTIATGGTGFAEGANVLTVVQAGGALGTISCTASAEGIITSIDSVASIGSGYAVANGLAVTGGTGSDCTVNITVINGAVATVSKLASGTGYTVGAGKATTGGTGTGATIEISTTDGVAGAIATFHKSASGTGYSVANGLVASGGNGDAATFNITVINGAVASFTTIPTHDGYGYTTGTKETSGSVSGVGATVGIASVSTYATKSEDITQEWLPRDTCELWVHSDGTATAGVRNFRIAYDDAPLVAVNSTNS